MENQWNPVVLRKNPAGKKTTVSNAKPGQAGVETTAKFDNSESVKKNRLDDATDAQATAKISVDFKKALMQARSAKGWTQKELGAKIGEKAATVQLYENGKAIPNPQIIAKLSRALGVKLPKIQKVKAAED